MIENPVNLSHQFRTILQDSYDLSCLEIICIIFIWYFQACLTPSTSSTTDSCYIRLPRSGLDYCYYFGLGKKHAVFSPIALINYTRKCLSSNRKQCILGNERDGTVKNNPLLSNCGVHL